MRYQEMTFLRFSLVWGRSQTRVAFMTKIILNYQVLYIIRKVLISTTINRQQNWKILYHVKVTTVWVLWKRVKSSNSKCTSYLVKYWLFWKNFFTVCLEQHKLSKNIENHINYDSYHFFIREFSFWPNTHRLTKIVITFFRMAILANVYIVLKTANQQLQNGLHHFCNLGHLMFLRHVWRSFSYDFHASPIIPVPKLQSYKLCTVLKYSSYIVLLGTENRFSIYIIVIGISQSIYGVKKSEFSPIFNFKQP